MTKRRRRKCLNCWRLFRPDPRNVRHQRYCSAGPCRKASKAASQACWLSKFQNRNYFRGPEHVAGTLAGARRAGAWRTGTGRLGQGWRYCERGQKCVVERMASDTLCWSMAFGATIG